MKPIPRIGGILWPACLIIALLLILPSAIWAQDVGDEGADGTGEAVEEAGGDMSVVEEEGDVLLTTPAEPVTEEPVVEDGAAGSEQEPVEEPIPDFRFTAAQDFRVEDRLSDEGGSLAILWKAEIENGRYIVFHSNEGPNGPWQIIDDFSSDSQYIWEQPNYFGFFLSEDNKGSEEHNSVYTNYYPSTGVYEIGFIADRDEEDNLLGTHTIVAKLYDADITDYSNLEVYINLHPVGGDRKVILEYQEPIPGRYYEPWDNIFSTTMDLDMSNLKTTRPYYVQFVGEVGGKDKIILEIQPQKGEITAGNGDAEEFIFVSTDGGEDPLPDNRDPHWFRVYAVPINFVLPDPEVLRIHDNGGEEMLWNHAQLPRDEWLIGANDGEGAVASSNLWNSARTNTFLFSIFMGTAVMGFIFRARKGEKLFVRRIAGLDHVEEAIGRATEMGRPILYTTGLGGVADIATIASMNILGRVARKVADYDSRLINPHRDPIVMTVCQEVVQEAYIDAGRPDAFNKDDVFFLTDDQFAYTAAVDGIMMRDKPATIFLMGMFYAESLLLAETGASTGAIQIAGTDALAQLPFFVTACDYTLIGEELYAASAYLSSEPLLLGSLKGQDLAKMTFMIFIIVGTIWLCLGTLVDTLPMKDFFQKLFQVF